MHTEPEKSIAVIEKVFSTELQAGVNNEELISELASAINHLVEQDFGRLVSLLYRIDVDEKALKHLLKENSGTDAGTIIAQLIIGRQLKKIKSRQQFSRRDNDIPDGEKW